MKEDKEQAHDRGGRPDRPRKSIVKRVRVTPEVARRFERNAKTLDMSEAEALRYGIELVDNLAARKRNMHRLLAEADIPGDDLKFELK